jgi:hypothetical protein
MDFLFYNVNEAPGIFPPNRIFVIEEDAMIILKCPCGCGDVIKLSTVPDASPKWIFHYPNTIKPSIRRTVNCKAHFSIENGKVKFH